MMPADAGGQHAHREGGNREHAEAQRLGGAIGGVSPKPGGVEPQQRLAREAGAAGEPDEQRSADADQEGRVGVDPEDRRADQKIAQGAAADAGDDREEDEGDERLALFRGEQRARNREHARLPKGIIEQDGAAGICGRTVMRPT